MLILFGVEVGDLQVLRGIREGDSAQDHWLPPGPKSPFLQVKYVCVYLSVCLSVNNLWEIKVTRRV